VAAGRGDFEIELSRTGGQANLSGRRGMAVAAFKPVNERCSDWLPSTTLRLSGQRVAFGRGDFEIQTGGDGC